jgi:predicted amidohydrolase
MLAAKAAEDGAQIICFHELCLTGYTWLRHLSKIQLFELAEDTSNSKSITKLTSIARQLDVAILAGLVEQEKGKIYNTFVCVTRDGLIAKHRKLHPFISPYLSAGDNYTVFELFGTKCGILICYDNNVIENVRATALLGAEVLFAPHVTGCTPSPMPGRGYVDSQLWRNREHDPVSLRLEFEGRKHRKWLLRWLPTRAYDNGIYIIFANPIGMDDDQLKGGASMIIDPFGDILAECRDLENQVVTAFCTAEKIEKSGGYRYRKARRPELYGEILSTQHNSRTEPVWLQHKDAP